MTNASYSQLKEAKRIFNLLLNDKTLAIPDEIRALASNIKFVNDQSEEMLLPCRLKECEVSAALKAVEATVAISISNERLGKDDTATVDLQHSLMFLFMTYLSSIDGYTKLDKEVKKYLKDTDLNQAQSILYRRMSANLYKSKDKNPQRYYHIHGSLDASTQLKLIGLPSHDPSLTDYMEVVNTIQEAVEKFTVEELEQQTLDYRQAGVEAMKYDDFIQTHHGKVMTKEPWWTIDTLEDITPPSPFTALTGDKPQILSGVKVIELCRVIAGPTIGRVLAEYGAEVIKVASDKLPDVPFFQVDCNVGKHTTSLDLRESEDRLKFDALLEEADVVLDGYRTHAIEKLGYGPQKIRELAEKRGKGYVYASENCFGFKGEWSSRAGWQQIADCVSGVAWIQGQSLGLDEPMVPPFPMSDYGTGELVAIAVMLALHKRSKFGGSYWCKSSLLQYNLMLMSQGLYPDEVWKKILEKQDAKVFELRYFDSVDKISSTCLRSMKKKKPELFDGNSNDDGSYFFEEYSPYFRGAVKLLKPVVKMNNTRNGFNCPTRPNATDPPEWFMK